MKIYILEETKVEKVRDYDFDRIYGYDYRHHVPMYKNEPRRTYSVYFAEDADASVSTDDILLTCVGSTGKQSALDFARKLQAGTEFEIVTNFARPIELKVTVNATSVEDAIKEVRAELTRVGTIVEEL